MVCDNSPISEYPPLLHRRGPHGLCDITVIVQTRVSQTLSWIRGGAFDPRSRTER